MLAGPLHGRLVTTLDAGPTPRWLTHDLTPYAGHRAHFEFGPEGDHPLDVLMVVESTATPTFQPVSHWSPSGSPTSLAALATAYQKDLLRSLDLLAANELTKAPELAPLAAWIRR